MSPQGGDKGPPLLVTWLSRFPHSTSKTPLVPHSPVLPSAIYRQRHHQGPHASPGQGFSILVTQTKAQGHTSEREENRPPQPHPDTSLSLSSASPCLYHLNPPEQHRQSLRDDCDHARQRTDKQAKLLPRGKCGILGPGGGGCRGPEGARVSLGRHQGISFSLTLKPILMETQEAISLVI